jgi:hypothetical protein
MMKRSAGTVADNLREFFQPRMIGAGKDFVSECFEFLQADHFQRFLHGVAPGFHDSLDVEIFVFQSLLLVARHGLLALEPGTYHGFPFGESRQFTEPLEN